MVYIYHILFIQSSVDGHELMNKYISKMAEKADSVANMAKFIVPLCHLPVVLFFATSLNTSTLDVFIAKPRLLSMELKCIIYKVKGHVTFCSKHL